MLESVESEWEPAKEWLPPLLGGGERLHRRHLGRGSAAQCWWRLGQQWGIHVAEGCSNPGHQLSHHRYRHLEEGLSWGGILDSGPGAQDSPSTPACPCCVVWLLIRWPGKLLSAVGGCCGCCSVLPPPPFNMAATAWVGGAAQKVQQDGAQHSVPPPGTHHRVDAARGSRGAVRCSRHWLAAKF